MEEIKLHKEKMRSTVCNERLTNCPTLTWNHRGAALKAMEKEDKSEVTQTCRGDKKPHRVEAAAAWAERCVLQRFRNKQEDLKMERNSGGNAAPRWTSLGN